MSSNPTNPIDPILFKLSLDPEIVARARGVFSPEVLAIATKDMMGKPEFVEARNAIEALIQAARIEEVRKHQLDTWGTTAAECSEYMSYRLKELSK